MHVAKMLKIASFLIVFLSFLVSVGTISFAADEASRPDSKYPLFNYDQALHLFWNMAPQKSYDRYAQAYQEIFTEKVRDTELDDWGAIAIKIESNIRESEQGETYAFDGKKFFDFGSYSEAYGGVIFKQPVESRPIMLSADHTGLPEIHLVFSNLKKIRTLPVDKETADLLLSPPAGGYEVTVFFTVDRADRFSKILFADAKSMKFTDKAGSQFLVTFSKGPNSTLIETQYTAVQ